MSGSRKRQPPLRKLANPRFFSSLRQIPTLVGQIPDIKALRHSGFFDAGYYLWDHPDVAAFGMDPVTHYVRHGAAELRNPHPLFDTAFYRGHQAVAAADGPNPLLHFLTRGAAEGRDPAPCFSIAGYRARHPEVGNENPLLHFLRRGFHRPESCRVSIVIPDYNQAALTLRCLAALSCRADRTIHEIIVVDDCSDADYRHLLNRLPGLTLLRHKRNAGFVATCNTGAQAARGEYLLFLNNDTVVQDGWIDALCRTFDEHEGVGLVGSKLLYPDGRLQEAGGIIWRDGTGCNYGRGGDPGRPEFNFVRDVDYCSGASLMIPTALFHRLGGFNVEFAPAYYEDTDLAFRVREAHHRVLYQPASAVVHLEGASCGRDESAGVKRYQAVNRMKFVARWRDELAARPEGLTLPFPLSSLDRTPRLLIIDTWIPTPDRDSGSVRMWNLARMLRHAGLGVTFLPQNMEHNGAYTERLQQLGVECVYGPYYRDARHFLAVRGREYSYVWIARVDHAREYLEDVRREAPAAQVILDTVDVHFLRLQRQAALSGNPEDRLAAERTRREELRCAAASDAVVVVSDYEQALLSRSLPAEKVHLISNIHRCRPVTRDHGGRAGVLFVGGFAHPPNVDAVRYLAAEIWPRVLERRPQARLSIVGSNPPESLRALESPSVRLLGFVPELTDLYDQALVSVAPLRYGAGVKGKINESQAHGVPVVTTSIGAEGMHCVHGEHLLVADTPEEFAAAILRLMDDRELWQALSSAGQLTVDRHFSPAAARRGWEGLLAYLATRGEPPR